MSQRVRDSKWSIAFVFIIWVASIPFLGAREFEDRFGRLMEADLLSHHGVGEDTITILKDGKQIDVRIDLFSAKDQEFIGKWMTETPAVLPKRFGSLADGMLLRLSFDGLKKGVRRVPAQSGDGSGMEIIDVLSFEAGVLGEALVVDGKRNSLKLGQKLLKGRNEFSVSFWFKTRESRSSHELWRAPTLFGQVTNDAGSGDLGIVTQSGYIGLFHGLGRGDFMKASTMKVNEGEWHHVVLVCDPEDKISLVVNGRWLISADPPKRGVNGRVIAIGASNHGPEGLSSWHEGAIDELMVWDRALSASEIGELNVLRYRPSGS